MGHMFQISLRLTMKQYVLPIFLLPFLTNAQLPIVTDLPDPVILLVGPTGSGKSSLANALLVCDPRSPDCLFPVCHDMDSCTKDTTYGTGNWLGDGQNFTVVDSPGFNDSDGEDAELIEEMLDVLKNTIKHSSTILLVLKGTENKFTKGLQDMLTKMSSIFGQQWWDFMVIGVSFWKFDQESIDGRAEECEYYPDSCKDEAWFMREINKELQEKFHIEKDFTFSFIDSWSQTKPNDEDEIQQDHFQEEAGVLWDETISRNSSLVFKGIDDVLDENAEMRERIKWLEEVITNNITMLMSRMDTNEQNDRDQDKTIGDNENNAVADRDSLRKDLITVDGRVDANEQNDRDQDKIIDHNEDNASEERDSLRKDLITVDGRVDTVDGRLTEVDANIVRNITAVDGRVDTVDGRVDTVDANIVRNITAVNGKVSDNELGICENTAVTDLVRAHGFECGYFDISGIPVVTR